MKKLTTLLLAALALLPAQAATMDYSFNLTGQDIDYFGTGKKENYNVAICLNDPLLAGAKVVGINVPIPGETENYSSPSAFMTKVLNTDRVDGVRVNLPDICSVDATIENGILSATFAEPYVLTEEPVYIGYSFHIDKLTQENKTPVAVVSGFNPDGFWFFSSRTALKWNNYVDRATDGYQSAMTVLLDGDFHGNAATPALPGSFIVKTGEESNYVFQIINYGSNTIESVDIEWQLGDLTGSNSCELHPGVQNAWGAVGSTSVTLPAIETQGYYPVNIKITKVNGSENMAQVNYADQSVTFSPVVPVNLPLVEEYTGLWCGWCTRGYAALEWMKEEHGYNFVAAAWHNGDEMQITGNYPNSVTGFPNAYINRSLNLDPGNIPAVWANMITNPVDMAITCSTEFTDDDKTELKATADVTAVVNKSDLYTIGYLLVADGLTNEKWGQANYYPGYPQLAGDLPGEWGEFFMSAGSPVYGLVFNDVVVSNEYSSGVKDSLPAEIAAFQSYENEVTFDLTSLTIPEVNPDKVRVIAFILDAGRNVINSCSSLYPGDGIPSGTVEVVNGDEVVSTIWYDLQGRKIAAPHSGIAVKVDTLSDGTIRASKVAVRR